MKKLLMILLCAMMVFSFAACGGEEEATETTEPVTEEITLEDAIYNFLEDESQNYFLTHLEEYPLLSGDEIEAAILGGGTMNVAISGDTGTWSGRYLFESDGDILETIYDGSADYYNEKTWKIQENVIILTSGYTEKTFICEMREVQEGTYLLTFGDDELYAIIGKGVDDDIDY